MNPITHPYTDMVDQMAQTKQPKRAQILDEAKKVICEDRQDVHGAPEDTHGLIAQYWSVYLSKLFQEQQDLSLTGQNVAELMILFKLARNQMNSNHPDSMVDLIGYAAISVEIGDKNKGN